jgi:hypothetical protein
MVALFISNTKKVLISLLFFGIMTSCKCINHPTHCKNIDDFLKLEFSFKMDTVRIGETVEINVIFKNKTDKMFQFYPNASLYITKPFVAFGVDFAFPVCDTLDFTKTDVIKPRAINFYRYDILINKNFFKLGDNRLVMHYRCNELKGENRIYNKLCGSLSSQEIKLVVVP